MVTDRDDPFGWGRHFKEQVDPTFGYQVVRDLKNISL